MLPTSELGDTCQGETHRVSHAEMHSDSCHLALLPTAPALLRSNVRALPAQHRGDSCLLRANRSWVSCSEALPEKPQVLSKGNCWLKKIFIPSLFPAQTFLPSQVDGRGQSPPLVLLVSLDKANSTSPHPAVWRRPLRKSLICR